MAATPNGNVAGIYETIQATVTIGATAGTVLTSAQTVGAKLLTLVNTGSTNINIGFGDTDVVINEGIFLYPRGSVALDYPQIPNGVRVSAIGSGAGGTLAVMVGK